LLSPELPVKWERLSSLSGTTAKHHKAIKENTIEWNWKKSEKLLEGNAFYYKVAIMHHICETLFS